MKHETIFYGKIVFRYICVKKKKKKKKTPQKKLIPKFITTHLVVCLNLVKYGAEKTRIFLLDVVIKDKFKD